MLSRGKASASQSPFVRVYSRSDDVGHPQVAALTGRRRSARRRRRDFRSLRPCVFVSAPKKPSMSGSRTSRSSASWTTSVCIFARHSARRRSAVSRINAARSTSGSCDVTSSGCADASPPRFASRVEATERHAQIIGQFRPNRSQFTDRLHDEPHRPKVEIGLLRKCVLSVWRSSMTRRLRLLPDCATRHARTTVASVQDAQEVSHRRVGSQVLSQRSDSSEQVRRTRRTRRRDRAPSSSRSFRAAARSSRKARTRRRTELRQLRPRRRRRGQFQSVRRHRGRSQRRGSASRRICSSAD